MVIYDNIIGEYLVTKDMNQSINKYIQQNNKEQIYLTFETEFRVVWSEELRVYHSLRGLPNILYKISSNQIRTQLTIKFSHLFYKTYFINNLSYLKPRKLPLTQLHSFNYIQYIYLYNNYIYQQLIIYHPYNPAMQNSNLSSYLEKADSTVFLGDLVFQSTFSFERISEEIKKAFPNAAEIDNIRVYDKKGNHEIGTFYAFVIFKSANEAKKALEFKTLEINEKKIQIEKYFVEREYQIYIKDIGKLSRSDIEKQFSRFGKIDNIHIDKTYNNNVSCSIKFETIEESKKCLSSGNIVIKGQTIRIQQYIDHNKQQKNDSNKIVIKKIPIQWDRKTVENELQKELSRFGQLQRPLEIKDGKFYRSAIALYENNNCVTNAIKSFNKLLLNTSQPLQIQNFIVVRQRNTKDSIFLNNLRSEISINQIVETFSIFGKIESNSIYKVDNNREKLQRGNITYATKQSYTQALVNASSDKKIRSLFINGVPKINIYQDKSQRADFKKVSAVKKNIPQIQNVFNQPPNVFNPSPLGFPLEGYPQPQKFVGMIPSNLNMYPPMPMMMPPVNFVNPMYKK